MGRGGLIASENRTLHFELCTGVRCDGGGGGANSASVAVLPVATVIDIPADGYSLELNYGECPAPGLQYLSLEWHELRSDSTPKDCTVHDLEDPAGA